MRWTRSLLLIAAILPAAASGAAPSVSPNLSLTTGGWLVHITIDETIDCAGTCKPPTVLFDGIASTAVTVDSPHMLSVITPPHPKEAIVPVTIIIGSTRVTLERMFAYIEPRDPMLVPFAFESMPGSGGSIWTTELWVHNSGDHDVALLPRVCSDLDGLHDCPGDLFIVAAGSSRLLPATASEFDSPGTYFFLPRADAGQLAFDLRIMDLTHPQTSATAVPIIRRFNERTKLVLLNVPNDNDSRKLLRVYPPWYLLSASFPVHIYDAESGQRLADEIVTVRGLTDVGGPAPPAYAATTFDIFDVPEVRRARTLRVEIESPVPVRFWALLSVTDNVTQHVTIITPDQ